MTYLSDAELASMRQVSACAMPDQALLQRKTDGSDGQGGQTEAWNAGLLSACEVVRKTSPGMTAEGGAQVSVTRWGVRMPYGTDVRAGDRITVNGAIYEVTDVDAPRSYSLAVTANCKRLN